MPEEMMKRRSWKMMKERRIEGNKFDDEFSAWRDGWDIFYIIKIDIKDLIKKIIGKRRNVLRVQGTKTSRPSWTFRRKCLFTVVASFQRATNVLFALPVSLTLLLPLRLVGISFELLLVGIVHWFDFGSFWSRLIIAGSLTGRAVTATAWSIVRSGIEIADFRHRESLIGDHLPDSLYVRFVILLLITSGFDFVFLESSLFPLLQRLLLVLLSAAKNAGTFPEDKDYVLFCPGDAPLLLVSNRREGRWRKKRSGRGFTGSAIVALILGIERYRRRRRRREGKFRREVRKLVEIETIRSWPVEWIFENSSWRIDRRLRFQTLRSVFLFLLVYIVTRRIVVEVFGGERTTAFESVTTVLYWR